jgi:NADH:ubiquinone oxidoreductase subunit 5 (subunit L)/multisubunit Na+/H+ antiporter MnhA subunit
MPQRHNKPAAPAFLLKSAAALAALLGLGIVLWLADKWLRHPEIQASQLGAVAPLWLPMIVFVTACSVSAAVLFLRAARRLERGVDSEA